LNNNIIIEFIYFSLQIRKRRPTPATLVIYNDPSASGKSLKPCLFIFTERAGSTYMGCWVVANKALLNCYLKSLCNLNASKSRQESTVNGLSLIKQNL